MPSRTFWGAGWWERSHSSPESCAPGGWVDPHRHDSRQCADIVVRLLGVLKPKQTQFRKVPAVKEEMGEVGVWSKAAAHATAGLTGPVGVLS